MRRFVSYTILLLAITTAFAASCALPDAANTASNAQAIVDRIASKYPDIVRLTIHAVPTGESASRIIACNVPARIGQASDPEDLSAITTGNPTVLREGDALDYTAAIRDASGKPIAATGITVRAEANGRGHAECIAEAEKIALEIQEAIRNAGGVLW